MKKIIPIIILLVACSTSNYAQNANRSGFFIEGGAGFLVGNPPIKKVIWKDNVLSAVKPSGPDINLGLGYRRASSRAFAWEVKTQFSIVPSAKNTMNLAILPGIRYTTTEIFSNTSLYFGLNVGFALGTESSFYAPGMYPDQNWERSPDIYDFCSVGGKINLTAGFNVSSSFYAGLYFDYSIMNSQFGRLEQLETENFDVNSWGSVGVRLGYRF